MARGPTGSAPTDTHERRRPSTAPGAHHCVAVRHRAELLAAITVTQLPGNPLSPSDVRLLDDFASQAGLVVRNVRLTVEVARSVEAISAQAAEIRASRRRIVDVQDAERRRVERDIHDGAEQYLVALLVQLGVVRTLARRDPQRGQVRVADLQRVLREALQTLADLAQGIHPPLLTTHGLAEALRRQEANPVVRVSVEDRDIGRYPIDVEAAVHFVVLGGAEQRNQARPRIGRRRVSRGGRRASRLLGTRRRRRVRSDRVQTGLGTRQHGGPRRGPRW